MNSIKSFIKFLFSLLGVRISKLPSSLNEIEYDDESEARRKFAIVRDYTMADEACLITLWQHTKYLETNSIVGDYVECGVWKGGCVALMALGNLSYGSTRRNIYLFDSFTDICEPDKKVDGDKAIQQATEWSTTKGTDGKLKPLEGFYDQFGGHGTKAACIEVIEKKVGYDKEKVHYIEGWFQDTFPIHSKTIGQIALLRLDADWYASTKICLETFYDKVVDGGIIIIDDYGTYEGCKKAVDEFFLGKKKPLLNHINKHSRYIIK
jgi:O-methyltransferase